MSAQPHVVVTPGGGLHPEALAGVLALASKHGLPLGHDISTRLDLASYQVRIAMLLPRAADLAPLRRWAQVLDCEVAPVPDPGDRGFDWYEARGAWLTVSTSVLKPDAT